MGTEKPPGSLALSAGSVAKAIREIAKIEAEKQRIQVRRSPWSYGSTGGRTSTVPVTGFVKNYNWSEGSMETVTVESIPITLGQEDDGRWWADVESMPGVMAYGDSQESAIAAVRALALRVAADGIDHGEDVPSPLAKIFA